MFEGIDPRSPTPLYEQIAERIRLAVATEELAPGDGLPSVRQLAARLRINPATVVQAYRDLEGEGFVEMRHGAGTFVGEIPCRRRGEELADQARRLIRNLMTDAARMGITAEELRVAFSDEMSNGAHD
jgi:DNA-binding transcriptional regulator YhcF (GntR family)